MHLNTCVEDPLCDPSGAKSQSNLMVWLQVFRITDLLSALLLCSLVFYACHDIVVGKYAMLLLEQNIRFEIARPLIHRLCTVSNTFTNFLPSLFMLVSTDRF